MESVYELRRNWFAMQAKKLGNNIFICLPFIGKSIKLRINKWLLSGGPGPFLDQTLFFEFSLHTLDR